MGVVDSHELVVDGLPFARPSTHGGLVAEVMWPLPHLYDEALNDLDRLEGYHPERPEASFYIRTEVTVRTAQGDVQAWLYEAGEQVRDRLRHLARHGVRRLLDGTASLRRRQSHDRHHPRPIVVRHP